MFKEKDYIVLVALLNTSIFFLYVRFKMKTFSSKRDLHSRKSKDRDNILTFEAFVFSAFMSHLKEGASCVKLSS